MYIYDNYDQQIVEDRVRQFRDQTRRYFAGELTEDEYLPLRLKMACIYNAMRLCCVLLYLTVSYQANNYAS